MAAECETMLDAAAQHPGTVIFVTNEVGMGIVPENAQARHYRDLVGRANQVIAGRAESVTLLACGIPLVLKGPQAVMSLLDETLPASPPKTPAGAIRPARLDQLIMPHWALGRLMDLAIDLAGIARSLHPPVARKTIITMAGDHGVAAEGVSKYPQEVTRTNGPRFRRRAGGHQRSGPAGRRTRDGGRHGCGRQSGATGRGRENHLQAGRSGHANIAPGPAMTRGNRPCGPSKRASKSSTSWPTASTCSAPATWASPTPRPPPRSSPR